MTAQEEVIARLRRMTAGSAPVRETDEYRERLRTRVRELRSQGVQYPEAAAREQLQREAQKRSEQRQRREVHDALMHRPDAEAERDHWIAEADKKTGASRTTALLFAQFASQAARAQS
ncbi:hypothetical protein AB0D60_10695 [Streptomyces sp. NPDC048306]|uniref:hypothetical protein n=1 Tax=Streptomyces sp. NPDC048306 TaxID=3154502 RepID=UPI0034018142